MKEVLYTAQMATLVEDNEYDNIIKKLNEKKVWTSEEIDDFLLPIFLKGYLDGAIIFHASINEGLEEDIELV